MNLKNSLQPRQRTEGAAMKPHREARAQHLADEGGYCMKRRIPPVFFRVLPWQMQFLR